MATNAQIEELLASVATTNSELAQLNLEREKLQGYKAEKQRFNDLVDAQKLIVDGLVAASETGLRDLADKIDVVFP